MIEQFALWSAAHEQLIFAGLGIVGAGVLAIKAKEARAARAERERRRAAQREQRFGRHAAIEGDPK